MKEYLLRFRYEKLLNHEQFCWEKLGFFFLFVLCQLLIHTIIIVDGNVLQSVEISGIRRKTECRCTSSVPWTGVSLRFVAVMFTCRWKTTRVRRVWQGFQHIKLLEHPPSNSFGRETSPVPSVRKEIHGVFEPLLSQDDPHQSKPLFPSGLEYSGINQSWSFDSCLR